MRIILLVDRYLPSPLSSAKLLHDLSEEMSRLGHDVIIVTGDHSLSTAMDVSMEGKVTILRVRSGKIRHRFKVIRAINEIRLSGIIWKAAHKFFKNNPCDLVVCYSPTIFWSGLVRRLKALHSCSSYLVLRDLFPQWAVDAGLIRKYSFPYFYFKYHELKLYQAADVIGVQSPANLDYFLAPNLRKRYNLEVLFNWTKISDHTENFGLRHTYGLQDKVIFMYGGNLGVAQDMDNILRLATNLKDSKFIHFLLVGDGSEFSRIEHLVKKHNMNNVKLLPAVTHDDYLRILAECDVGLITLRRDLKTQNFPGKMLSYMELQKPMLASINPGNDLQSVIHDYNAGLVCENGEDDVFCQYALKLANNRDLRMQMGINARNLLKEKFDVTAAAQQIVSHFQKNASEVPKI